MLNKIHNLLLPDLIVDRKDWRIVWKIRKRELFFRYTRIGFITIGIVYFIHPFAIEIPIKAENITNFIAARWGVALFLFVLVAFERFHILKVNRYTALFSIFILIPCYLQGLSLGWDSRVPWIFNVIVPLLFCSILFTSFLIKVVQYAIGTLIQLPFLLDRLTGNDIPTFISIWLTGFVVIALLGFIYVREVENFMADQRYREQVQKNREIQAELFRLTSQVAHDIRSPLAALKVISHDLFELSEDKRLILRKAIDRVNDIANTLAYRNFEKKIKEKSSFENPNQVIILSGLIDRAVTEKRIQYRLKLGVEIQTTIHQDSYGLFVDAEEVELERMFSNLIDNAVEALDERGIIHVQVKYQGKSAFVILTDNGKGIPEHVLQKVGNRGFTFGKESGSGLGLFHAMTQLSKWGGISTLSLSWVLEQLCPFVFP